MSTIDAIKAALVHPPETSSSVPDGGSLGPGGKSSDIRSLGAKKKKTTKPPIRHSQNPEAVPNASKQPIPISSCILQVPGKKKDPKKKLAQGKSPVTKNKAITIPRLPSPNQAPLKKRPASTLHLFNSKSNNSAGSSTGFSELQLEKLNLALSKNKEPGLVERKALAKETNLSEFHVGGWFKRARSNLGDAVGKKDVNRPHFLASKLVQPSDARRHMVKNTTSKVVKNNVNISKPDKKVKNITKRDDAAIGEKKPSFGAIFSNLKPGTIKGKKSVSDKHKNTGVKKLDIPALSSMNQILEVKNRVVNSGDSNIEKKGGMAEEFTLSRSKGETGNESIILSGADEGILILDNVEKPVAEVIDIIDDGDITMVVHEEVPTQVKEFDKEVVKKGQKKQAAKSEDRLRVGDENLLKELKEKTKIVQNLEVKIPQMISEFTKCVGEKDEVISAKDKEIKTNKQKIGNFEKDVKILQSRNKNTSSELAAKAKEVDSLKKEFARDNKENLEHLQKMDGLEAKVAKLIGVLAKKDEEISKLNVRGKELQKKEDESRKLLVKEKEVTLKLKAKDKDLEMKFKAKNQESSDKVKELENIINAKDQHLKSAVNNDSIKTKTTFDSHQKQISKLRSTVKFQEKEILSLKEKESRLNVQVADLECDNYTKAAELDCKTAELDKFVNKVKQSKSSGRRLSIYEATKDYIEKLKENRQMKANVKNQEVNEDTMEVNDIDEDKTESNDHENFNGSDLVDNSTGARPKVVTLVHQAHSADLVSPDGSAVYEQQSMPVMGIHSIKLVRKTTLAERSNITSSEYYLSMVSHQCYGWEAPQGSMLSHWVGQGEDGKVQIIDGGKPSGRKFAVRSSSGIWGQVYRARGLDQEVVVRRAGKRVVCEVTEEGCDWIPTKKRKLQEVEEIDRKSLTSFLHPAVYVTDDSELSPVKYIVEYLITSASTENNKDDDGLQQVESSWHSGSLRTGLDITADTDPVLYSSMVVHQLYSVRGLGSYSSISHEASNADISDLASYSFLSHVATSSDFSTPATIFLSYSSHQESPALSLLSHQVQGHPHHGTILPSHSQEDSSLPYQPTDINDSSPAKTIKRQLDEDNHPIGLPLKRQKFDANQELAAELVLKIVSLILIPSPHKSLSCDYSLLTHKVVKSGESSFTNISHLSHQVQSSHQLVPRSISSLLTHQVQPLSSDMPSPLTHQVNQTEDYSCIRPSLLSHQIQSYLHLVPSYISSLITHQIQPSSLSQLSCLSHQVASTVPPHSFSVLAHQASSFTNISIQEMLISQSILTELGGQKRRLSETPDSPVKGKRLRLRLASLDHVLSISPSCKRGREDDLDCSPPPKRLKMSSLSSITLHFNLSTLSTLPEPRHDWQLVKYQPRKTLLDFLSTKYSSVI